MALKDIFKVSGKTFFNPSGWVGYKEVKTHTNFIWSTIRSLVIPPTAGREETFDEAMQRLDVSNADVEIRKATYFNYALIFVVLGCLLVFYSFYLAVRHHTLAGFALGLASAALFFSQAFKYHFWYTQIKLRKLGITYQEWRKSFMSEVSGSNNG